MMKPISFMKTSKVLLREQEVTGNRVQIPSGPATVMGKPFSSMSLDHPGKTEKEADDPEPGDLPCMCHRTLRGKEWCTKNQETGEPSVRLAGPLRPCSHRSIHYRAVDCLLECTYIRIPSVIRMGFFCLFSGNQSGINLESEWIEHAAKKKVGQAVLLHCFRLQGIRRSNGVAPMIKRSTTNHSCRSVI